MKRGSQDSNAEPYKRSIQERFSIKQTIGKGTFGKVKLGINKETNCKVAIKILEKNRIVTKEDYERVERELAILSKFSHQNIVQTYEIINCKENFYIIMEYCEGGELFNHIVEKQRLSEKESAFYYYQLIKGLEYIHAHKVIHRDLKPENLLLGRGNMLKIIDFGLSNYYTGRLLITPCGSPCYASPEMVSGNNYNGFYIDVWSTGIILFAMLCGYLPFEDECNDVMFQKILECKPHYPSHISSLAKGLLMKILVTNPEMRIKIEDIKKHPFYLQGRALFNLERNSNSTQPNTTRHDRSENISLNIDLLPTNQHNDNIINCMTEGGLNMNLPISRNKKKKEMSRKGVDNTSDYYYVSVKTENMSKSKAVENNRNRDYYSVTSVTTKNQSNTIYNGNYPMKKTVNYNTKPISSTETSKFSRNVQTDTHLNPMLFDENCSQNSNHKSKPISLKSEYITNGTKSKEDYLMKLNQINPSLNRKSIQLVKDIRLDLGPDILNYANSNEKTQRSATAKVNVRENQACSTHHHTPTFRNSNLINIGARLDSSLVNKIIQEHTSFSPKTRQNEANSLSSIPHCHNFNSILTEGSYPSKDLSSAQTPKMNNYFNNDNKNIKEQAPTSFFPTKKPDTLYSEYLNSRRAPSELSSQYQPAKFVPSFNIHKNMPNLNHLSTNYTSNNSNSNTNNNTKGNINLSIPDYIPKTSEKKVVNRIRDNLVYLTTEVPSKNYTHVKAPSTFLSTKHNKLFNSRNVPTPAEVCNSYSKREQLTTAGLLPSSYAKHSFNTSLNSLKQQLKNMSRG